MPGWHDATEGLRSGGRLQMLGIVQEQNPDRCRLFMQWKQMKWPILVDTFDRLEVSVVPLTYAIDEYGIVRFAGLRLGDAETIRETFVDREWPAPDAPPASRPTTGDGHAALGNTERIEDAVKTFRAATRQAPEDGWAHFRLAAAYRLRYDSDARRPEDFQRAIDHWQRALDLDPNNYIWRRRIQQYGPRLEKPYPFYDWIPVAREELQARGEVPAQLSTEPTGSEIARPSRELVVSDEEAGEPDPEGRVHRDSPQDPDRRLILTEITSVPKRIEAGDSTRIHLVMRPNDAVAAHWNNETEPLRVWLNVPPGWRASSPLLEHANARSATSTEVRRLEFELEAPATGAAPGSHRVPGYALYYVCEDVDGTCLYRRQDFEIDLEVD